MGEPSLFDLIRSDIELKQHWFLKNDSWFNRNIRVYLEPGTIAVIVYRYGHWVKRSDDCGQIELAESFS